MKSKNISASEMVRIGSLLLLIFAANGAKSQTQVDLRTQSKSVDFSRATATSPVQTGTVLPGVCSVGALYFMTSAPAGANLYACVAANSWSVETGESSTSGSGAPTGACTVASVYDDTVNGNTWLCENGAWQKALTTSDTGTFVLTGQNGAPPAAPSTGTTSLFFNSTAKIAQSVDDTGGAGTMVRPTDCSGSGQLAQKVNADGTVTCAAAGGVVTASAPYTYFPFPMVDLDGSIVVPQSGQVRYYTFTPMASQTVDHIAVQETGSASNHLAFAIYSAGCSLLAASSPGTFTGGSLLSFSLAAQLSGGTTYFLALTSDSANLTDTFIATSNLYQYLNVAGTFVFSGANPATWSSGAVTFPASCGTQTGINSDLPAVLFY
jgi:hypothetical protein